MSPEITSFAESGYAEVQRRAERERNAAIKQAWGSLRTAFRRRTAAPTGVEPGLPAAATR